MKFEFTPEQWKKVQEWEKDHGCTLKTHGAIGGAITYEFAPTSIGMCQSASCACGKQINVTDYDSW